MDLCDNILKILRDGKQRSFSEIFYELSITTTLLDVSKTCKTMTEQKIIQQTKDLLYFIPIGGDSISGSDNSNIVLDSNHTDSNNISNNQINIFKNNIIYIVAPKNI